MCSHFFFCLEVSLSTQCMGCNFTGRLDRKRHSDEPCHFIALFGLQRAPNKSSPFDSHHHHITPDLQMRRLRLSEACPRSHCKWENGTLLFRCQGKVPTGVSPCIQGQPSSSLEQTSRAEGDSGPGRAAVGSGDFWRGRRIPSPPTLSTPHTAFHSPN